MTFIALSLYILILIFLLFSYFITVVLKQHDIDCFPMFMLYGLVLNVGILKRFSSKHKTYRGLYYITMTIVGFIAIDVIVIITKVVLDNF